MDVSITPAEATSAAPPPVSVIEVPREKAAYSEWRQTGKVAPERTPKGERSSTASAPEGSAPSTKAAELSDAAVDAAETDAPASEAGTQQEPKKRSNAETRLKDILDDLKRAGLSPAELKTFKREAQKAEAQSDTKTATPETTAQPESGPKEPRLEDFESYEKYQEALLDYRVDLKFHARDQARLAAEQQRETNARLEAARERYGADADQAISETAKAVFSDTKIPSAVKALLNDSPVMVDLLYTLGSKGTDLADFVELAKSNPGQAIRKAVLLEKLVTEELAKGASSADLGRDESGKFVSTKAPVKKITDAPPPPREASGRAAAPADEITSAIKANDFAAFRNASNRRDLAQRQGR